jgi:hypothetical protein
MRAKHIPVAAASFAFAFVSITAIGAPFVTMTRTPNVVRPQVQGGGMYDVYDYFWTNGPNQEFVTYQVIGQTTSGSFVDPSRSQDFRQSTSTNQSNTTGSVDTYANTVMTAAAADDGGYTATITANPAFYVPSGIGVASFTQFDWTVFDLVEGDDNDLSDHPDGPFDAAAQYHILRVLTTPGAIGSVNFSAFDTANGSVGTPFAQCLCQPDILAPIVGDLNGGRILGNRLAVFDAPPASDPNSGDSLTWSITSFSGSGLLGVSEPTIDPVTGEFRWVRNSGQAPYGPYTAILRATDQSGLFDEGTLSFKLVAYIPEPSAVALSWIAILGVLGLVGRR